MRISVASTEYVKVKVSATEAGAAVNPTLDTVKMAFVPEGPPDDGDWTSADWETAGSSYYARCLVGPEGGLELAENIYEVWVKVTDSPEVPVKRAGRLTVFA